MFEVPVPVKVRLLMLKSCPSVVARLMATFAVMNTSVLGPGSVATVPPAAVVHQLVLMAFPEFQFPSILPFQKAAASATGTISNCAAFVTCKP